MQICVERRIDFLSASVDPTEARKGGAANVAQSLRETPFERELIAIYSFPAPRRLTSSSPGSPKDNRTPESFCGGKNCVLPVPT